MQILSSGCESRTSFVALQEVILEVIPIEGKWVIQDQRERETSGTEERL